MNCKLLLISEISYFRVKFGYIRSYIMVLIMNNPLNIKMADSLPADWLDLG